MFSVRVIEKGAAIGYTIHQESFFISCVAGFMKLIKLTFSVLIVGLLAGFGYFALIDVTVPQQPVEKVIPNERIFDEN